MLIRRLHKRIDFIAAHPIEENSNKELDIKNNLAALRG